MDLDAFRWLLTDDGQLLPPRRPASGAGRRRRPLATQTRRDAARRARTGRGGAHPGHAAAARPRQTRRPRRPDVLHPGRPRAGDPAPRRRAPRGAAGRGVGAHARGPRVRHRRRPGRRRSCRPRRGGVDVDPVRVAVAEANLAALGLPGAVTVADATTLDTTPFDVAFADPARRSRADGSSTSTAGRRPGVRRGPAGP